jgi:2-polyprenyl-3-methyl-5-hydroxy-6-metoxy-1,4-benzoquinol methylase
VTWQYFDDPRPDVQRLIDVSGRRVLDVGCGSGALGAALKARGAALVAGIEKHDEAASRARARLDKLVHGDLEQSVPAFDRGEFDVIVFADVLEHLTDPDRTLACFLPLLAPGGRVVVSVPNFRFYAVLLRLAADRWSYTDSGVRDRTHLRVFTRRSLLALHQTAGLEVIRLERRYRLFEDQSAVGRFGTVASRVVCSTVAPLLVPDLMAFQYLVVSQRAR